MMRLRPDLPGPLLALALALGALLLASCGEDEGRQAGDGRAAGAQAPERLWGRTFASTEVAMGGEPRELVPGTRIEVSFERLKSGRIEHWGEVGWRAGCNLFGARAEITAERLLLRAVVGTEIGCAPELHRQDEWLADFFGSDPRWRLRGDRLTLGAGETTIELRAGP